MTKPRATVESLREALNQNKRLQYAHSCAIVNHKIQFLMDRPAAKSIERRKRVRIRAKPYLGHPRGDGSRRTERGNFTGAPGFRPLECWHELRDNPHGLVSSEASSSPCQVRVACNRIARALRGNSDKKDLCGLYVKCISHYRFLLSGRGE
jgi:hypothetical protein